MKIKYGTLEKNIDVTEFCYNNLIFCNKTIIISCHDHVRASLFSDPSHSVKKSIFINMDDNSEILEYDDTMIIKIDTINKTIKTINVNDKVIIDKLTNLQSKLKINHGDFQSEVPEQKMAVRYLTGNEKVLEIGSNIGRNSLIIASILAEKNNNNFVTIESDENIANHLRENRDLNNMNFPIVNAALSKRKLIQRGWVTIESDVLLDDYKWVNTITLEDLKSKHLIEFDTLILDCEGAIYYILLDMPEILNNVNLIIIENDFLSLKEKLYFNEILIKNNFYLDYLEGLDSGNPPCKCNFFEVWKKIEI